MCKGAYNDGYTGEDQCAHNMAKALFDAMRHLNTTVSQDSQDWEWRNVHVNEYPSMPWSSTPLKPFFHREIPVGGNTNTPFVSKYTMARIIDNDIIKSTHTANYRQVIQFSEGHKEDINLMSIDTGMSGNLFSGNYFTMNRAHLSGDLHQVDTDFDKLVSNSANYVLEIKP